MTTQNTSRNVTSVNGNYMYIYMLDDEHVRDFPFYRSHNSVVGYQFNAWTLMAGGLGSHVYSTATAQMTASVPGNYSNTVLTDLLVPDYVEAGSGVGCRDVFAEIRIIEVLNNNDIEANISNQRLYVRTSVNRQVTASNFNNEVPTSLFIYEDNSNIRSYSETLYIDEGMNYLTVADVDNITDPADLRVGPIKNFFVHDFPADSVLGKSFSFELNMNSEGAIYDARLGISKRGDSGNAS